MSSRFRSVQGNVNEAAAIGLYRWAPEFASPVVRAELYRFSETLTAVFPVPNRSYATPNRGAGSLKFGTFGVAANCRASTKRPAGDVCAGTSALTASHRRPALTVRRFRVHWSRSEEHTSELQSRQYLVC